MAATKEKEITIAEKLGALHELQRIDTKIDQIQQYRGELPMEVSDLEDEIEGLTNRVDKLDSGIKDKRDEIKELKNKIKEGEALVKKYEKQLNNVKNNREFDALNKESEIQKLDIQLAEKKIGKITEEIDNKKSYLKESKELLACKTDDLKLKKKELKKITAETEKEEASLTRKSKRAQKKIEERLINAYTRIRNNYRNGLAVVTVERDACGGCYNKIPPQKQLEIKQRKRVIVCEHCGRILVYAGEDIE